MDYVDIVGCTLAQLRSVVQQSWLSEKCEFLFQSSNCYVITRGFQQLLNNASFWDFRKMLDLLAGLCVFYLVSGPSCIGPRQPRFGLIKRLLQNLDCVDPMNVHQLVEQLLLHLRREQANDPGNLLYLSAAFEDCGWRGRPLAVCLLWSMAENSFMLDFGMHRYRELSELANAINQEPNFDMAEMTLTELRAFLMLLVAIQKLLLRLLFDNNDELHSAGYPIHFFQIARTDVESLRKWLIVLAEQLRPGERNELSLDMVDMMGKGIEELLATLANVPSVTEPSEEPPKLRQIPQDTYSDLSEDDF